MDCKTISELKASDYVFGVAKPLSIIHIERKKNRACDKAALKRIRLHDFRHSHALFQINNNLSSIYIANRQRHSNTKITITVYVHLLEQSKDLSVEMLNEVINKA